MPNNKQIPQKDVDPALSRSQWPVCYQTQCRQGVTHSSKNHPDKKQPKFPDNILNRSNAVGPLPRGRPRGGGWVKCSPRPPFWEQRGSGAFDMKAIAVAEKTSRRLLRSAQDSCTRTPGGTTYPEVPVRRLVCTVRSIQTSMRIILQVKQQDTYLTWPQLVGD